MKIWINNIKIIYLKNINIIFNTSETKKGKYK